jgi:MFS family permease
MAMLAAAIFCCCTTMSMPLGHIVAFCSDIGIGPRPGAAMLSLQLAAGAVSQQVWGWVADRLGSVRTILFASAAMAASMLGFLVTQDEIGLFSISAVFGLAFGGLIPGYVLAVREMFPVAEASWRIPIVMFPGAVGMAAGGWIAGLIYDRFGFYAPAFAAGIAFNLLNLALIGALVPRHRPPRLVAAT